MSFLNKDLSKQQTYKGSHPPKYPPTSLIKSGKEPTKKNGLEKFDINSESSQAVVAWANWNNPFDTTRTFIGTPHGVALQISEDVVSQGEPSIFSEASASSPFADSEDANDSSADDIEETDDENSSRSNLSKESKNKPLQNPAQVLLDVFNILSPFYENYQRPQLLIRSTIPFEMSVTHGGLKMSDSHRTYWRNGAYCISATGKKEILELLGAGLNDHGSEPVQLTFELLQSLSDEEFDKAVRWCLKTLVESGLEHRIWLLIELPYEHKMTSDAADAERKRLQDRVEAVAQSLVRELEASAATT